jgi:3-oxoacyl-[acyl-carrier protein] reductase
VSRIDPVVIVTGGSCGSGREVVRRLASRGYAVVVVYLRDQGEAAAAVEEIFAENGTALAVRADVTDELDVERLFDETIAAFGGVDVVVHAAMRGASIVSQEAARQLRIGGAIVNVSTADPIAPHLADELRARRGWSLPAPSTTSPISSRSWTTGAGARGSESAVPP